jgi:hypothetical protein
MPGKGMSRGIHLQLQTDKDTIPVHLGPAWYVQAHDSDSEEQAFERFAYACPAMSCSRPIREFLRRQFHFT